MALTLKEITGQIDNFLHQVPERYGMQAELFTIQANQAKHDLVKGQFEKIIFSELTDCVNTINDLTHTELTIEALQLRLLRIGMDLEQNNKGSIHVDLACLQDLSKVLGINDIEDNVKHQIAYASIAYFLARGCTVQETLENFALTKQVLQQGGRLPFAIIDVDFIKIYYAFCLVLSSFKTDNIIVHAAYDDLSVQDRIGNRIFEAGILSYAIRAVSFLTLLNLDDQIGVIVAYSAISATGYKRSQLCEPNYIEQAINFTTNEVKQEIIKRNISVSMFKYGNSTEAMRKAANEMMQLAFPEVAEKSAKLEATKEAIKDAQGYIHTVEEELERKLKEIDAHYRAIERQTISNINTQIAQAKRDAHSRSFRNTLTQVGIGVVTYFAGPIIGGAVQGMVNGGKLKDFVKAIAINLATGKMMGQLKVPNLTATTTTGTLQVGTRMLAAQNALLNSATHMAVSAVVNGKGKLDLVGMIAAGAGGAAGATMTDGFGKVVIERGVQAATSTLVHGGDLVHNIGAGIIDGAAFHAGTRMAAGLTNTVETLGSTRKANHKDSEVSSPKLRVENQLQATNQSSSNTTSLLQSDELAAAHRQANNIRWLKKLEMFSGGLEHFTSQEQASSSWDNNDFDLESMLYRSQSNVMLHSYQKYQVGTRAMGAMQAGFVSSPKIRVSKGTSRLSPTSLRSASLDQIQILSVKSISENDLAISPKQQQQLKSKPSWVSSILSFLTDLLFGSMAYADELPQSSDSASSSSVVIRQEGIFNIFKSAFDGDPNAQLEMRRRFPIGATFSDATNSSYRAWNDPILGFKNNVHNRLGASWFLPGSMDDLGQVCLNSSIAISGVSVVPKIAEVYSKVQFAYQAYRTTQGFRNRLPSDRIQHEAAKSLYRQNMEKPPIQDPKLAEHIDWLYKKDSTLGSGSTADAARLEKLTGAKFKGCDHVGKSSQSIKFLEKWLKQNTQANSGDRAAAENILSDMKDAIGQKKWYSQTKPPKP